MDLIEAILIQRNCFQVFRYQNSFAEEERTSIRMDSMKLGQIVFDWVFSTIANASVNRLSGSIQYVC